MRLGWFGRGQPPPKFASQRATVPLSDHVTPPINPVRNDHASVQTAGALYVQQLQLALLAAALELLEHTTSQ